MTAFNRMLNNYCIRQARTRQSPIIDQRANFRRELLLPYMTWATFVNKGLAGALAVVKMKVAIEITFANGQTQTHGIEADLTDSDITSESEELDGAD